MLRNMLGGFFMRQRLRPFLPIVLIALAVQILAPIAASWVAVVAASDPLRSIEICHSDSTSLPGQSGPADHRADDGACSICCLAQANASFDAPQPTAVEAPYPNAAPVLWPDDTADVPQSLNHRYAQARAPPQLT